MSCVVFAMVDSSGEREARFPFLKLGVITPKVKLSLKGDT
jgi:hypothetical protein